MAVLGLCCSRRDFHWLLWDLSLWHVDLGAQDMWDLSSPTGDGTCVPCTARKILNWTIKEVPIVFHSIIFVVVQSLSHFQPFCNNMDPCSPPVSSVHEDSPGKNNGVGCHFLFQGIFPTQGLNLGLWHCRQLPCHLSHQRSLHKYTIIYLFTALVMNVLVHSGWHNKIPQTGWLRNNRSLLLTVLQPGSPRSRCQHGCLLLRGPLPCSCCAFLLCPHGVEGATFSLESFQLQISPLWGMNPIRGGSALVT